MMGGNVVVPHYFTASDRFTVVPRHHLQIMPPSPPNAHAQSSHAADASAMPCARLGLLTRLELLLELGDFHHHHPSGPSPPPASQPPRRGLPSGTSRTAAARPRPDQLPRPRSCLNERRWARRHGRSAMRRLRSEAIDCESDS